MSSLLPQEPAKELLLEYSSPQKTSRILILEGGNGWLAREISKYITEGLVVNHDRDIRKIEKSKSELKSRNNAMVGTGALPVGNNWDIVLLTIPKERSFARILIISSFMSLKVGGRLLLAGPSNKGAKAVIKDAQRLFGNCTLLGYRSHQRVAQSIKNAESPEPLPKEFQTNGISPGSLNILKVDTAVGILQLETSPGIFSWEKPDQGSNLLQSHLRIDKETVVWDVGCGYGILGLTASLYGAKKVFMSDINILAIDYALKNAFRNSVSKKVLIFPAVDLTPPPNIHLLNQVDLIITNPAFHQGRRVDKSMALEIISRSSRYLKTGGKLLLVANRFLNYDKAMEKRFSHVHKIAENNQYHLIEGSV